MGGAGRSAVTCDAQLVVMAAPASHCHQLHDKTVIRQSWHNTRTQPVLLYHRPGEHKKKIQKNYPSAGFGDLHNDLTFFALLYMIAQTFIEKIGFGNFTIMTDFGF